jgi:hypothetical protein
MSDDWQDPFRKADRWMHQAPQTLIILLGVGICLMFVGIGVVIGLTIQ